MDQSSGSGGLVSYLPSMVTSGVSINLSTHNNVLSTFKQIERSHWDYLDKFRDYDRRRYPTLNIREYSKKLLQEKGYEPSMTHICNYIRQYNRYKKSLPTAGVILYHLTGNSVEFVVVCMRYADIWSMPKGKKDPEDVDLVVTARREFFEETGLDLDDCIHACLPSKTINRTKFYMLESDHTNHQFNGYNTKEISAVTWVSVMDVLNNRGLYSKQTSAVAEHLRSRFNVSV